MSVASHYDEAIGNVFVAGGGVAQLEEQPVPKRQVPGSSPGPASICAGPGRWMCTVGYGHICGEPEAGVVESGHTGSRRDGLVHGGPSLVLLGAAAPASVPAGRGEPFSWSDIPARGPAELVVRPDIDPGVARALRLWVREMECGACDALPSRQIGCGVCAGSGLGFDVGGEA